MNHIRFDLKERQNNKGKVIIGCNEHLRARISGILGNRTTSIYSWSAHLRPGEFSLIRANRDLQVIISALRNAFINMKTNDHPLGFFFDGWKPGILDFL